MQRRLVRYQPVEFGTNIGHAAGNHHPPNACATLAGFKDPNNTQGR
jgi:hypothetical protein